MKVIYVVLGLVCVGLGALGVALPVLPTTPFLLVAAFCFAKSSEKLNTWFRGTWLYKQHLETLKRGEGMTIAAKARIVTTVTIVMAISFFFMMRAFLQKDSRGALIGCICVVVVWVAHLIAFCFIIKTCPAEKAKERTGQTDA